MRPERATSGALPEPPELVQLRRSEERLRLALAGSRSGTFDWGARTDTNDWSDEMLALYGMRRDQFGGRYEDWIACLVPEDRAAGAAAVKRAVEGSDFALEFRIRRHDTGELRWMHGRGQVFFDAAGRPERMVGLNVDITDRKRAERRAEFLARFPEENPDPVMRLDAGAFILYANTAARRRLGPLGVDVGALAPAELADAARRALGERGRVKAEIACGDSVFSLSVVPVESEVNVYGQDITARKRAEEALRTANRQKDEFLSAASHELRTPLATAILQVQGLARMLSLGSVDDARVRRKLATTEAQLFRLNHLVGALLDVTRISGGRLVLDRHPCDLAQLATEAVERFEDVAERAGARLVLEASPVTGTWDRLRIEQVLTNLIDNALKHAPGSRVEIRVAASSGDGVLTVRDHGPGISADSQARIFQQYERAAEVHVFGGLGLGLWITRQIVEAHGGTITVESQRGAGSAFTVRLPAERA